MGVTLWDRLSVVTFLDGAFSDDPRLRVLNAPLGLGPGFGREFVGLLGAGIEARYRQLLWSSPIPLYLDFAVGGFWQGISHVPMGLAMYGEAGCNPTLGACRLHARGWTRSRSGSMAWAWAWAAIVAGARCRLAIATCRDHSGLTWWIRTRFCSEFQSSAPSAHFWVKTGAAVTDLLQATRPGGHL